MTVVIPVHNRAGLVADTLHCIQAQTRWPEEVVLVDNASTDGTAEVLEAWARKMRQQGHNVTVVNEPEPGAPHARNRGLAEVKTRWVMFFDSDDLMAPDHVANAMRTAEANPQAEIIGWDVTHLNLNGRRRRKPFETRHIVYHNIFHGNMATQRYMVLTKLVRDVDGWNPNVGVWNDVELGARLLALNPRVVKLRQSKTTVTVRAIADSITGTQFGPDTLRYMPALVSMRMTLPPELKNWIGMRCLILAAHIGAEGFEERARETRARLLAFTSQPARRRLMRFVYAYTHMGGRGVARLIRPLLCQRR